MKAGRGLPFLAVRIALVTHTTLVLTLSPLIRGGGCSRLKPFAAGSRARVEMIFLFIAQLFARQLLPLPNTYCNLSPEDRILLKSRKATALAGSIHPPS